MSRALGAAGVIVAAVALATAPVGGRQEPRAGGRVLASELSASAIDRGLRAFAAARALEGSPAEPFIRGSIIVKFRAGTSTASRRAIVAQIAGTARPGPSYADFDLVAIDRADDPEAAARRIAAQPDVDYAQARYRVLPRLVPNDPLYARQWNYPALDMERAWDINAGASSQVAVAVLDSGVAYRSAVLRFEAAPFVLTGGSPLFPGLGAIDVPFAAAPDLEGPGRFVAPADFIWNDDLPFDLDGHGTHVAGTVGQLTNNGIGVAGMAFNVRIMPVKVVAGTWDRIFGSPEDGTDDVVARGIRYATDNGARIINLSIGRLGPPAPVVGAAIAYAVSRGVFVAAAAGNEFERGNRTDRLAEFARTIDGMVAVGAVDRSRQHAHYSTTGAYIELVAPGGSSRVGGADGMILQQTFDFDFVDTYLGGPASFTAPRFDAFRYDFLQGTSMASPHVAGFAALLVQQGITRPAAIEAAMKQFATDLGAVGRDDVYGYGLINPRATLRGLGLAR